MTATPRASCLLVTEDRLGMFRRALARYAEQTWPDKELVVVTQGDAAYKASLVDEIARSGRDDVRLVLLDGRRSLGALRNASLDAATGDVWCLWDDDDLSHPDRLRIQIEQMLAQGARACFLTDRLRWFVSDRALFWESLRGGEGVARLALNTMVAMRDPSLRYPEVGPFSRVSEDSVFVDLLARRAPVAVIEGRGDLYVYTSHGSNTYADLNHRWPLAKSALDLADWPRPVDATLAGVLYDLETPLPVPMGRVEAQRLLDARHPRGPDRDRLEALAETVSDLTARAERLASIAHGCMDRARALLDLGAARLAAGRLDEAEASLREAVEAETPLPEATALLGDAALLRGDRATAVARFREALAHAPYLAETWSNLGIALAEAGDEEGAIDALTRAVLVAPGTARLHRNLRAGLARRDPAERLARYRDLSMVRPYAAVLALHHAAVAEEVGERWEAVARWTHAAALDPGAVEPLLRAGASLWALGASDRAVAALREAARRAPGDARPLALLGRGSMWGPRPEAALALLDDALRLDPELLPARLDRCALRLRLGDVDGASLDFEEASRRAPGHPGLRDLAGRLDAARSNGRMPRVGAPE